MTKISGVVIAKNEENMIVDCLDSLAFCKEIIVIDGGSEDRTVEIAKRMNAKVFEYISSDFSKIRNFGLKKASGDWILYVDADERVTLSLSEEIARLINNPTNKFAGLFIKRKNFYFGNYEWPYIENIERLFRKDSLKGWKGMLHENPIIDGKMGILEGFLNHYTHRNLTSMLEKTIEWSKIEAELRYRDNHPRIIWWRFPRVMITAFFDSYIKQKGWKIGIAGLVESMFQAFSIFVTYARLWEMQKKLKVKNER